jgi:hypothetical protein
MTNHKDQKNYEARQKTKGFVLVKVWVPKESRVKLTEYAEKLRAENEEK